MLLVLSKMEKMLAGESLPLMRVTSPRPNIKREKKGAFMNEEVQFSSDERGFQRFLIIFALGLAYAPVIAIVACFFFC